MLLKKNKIVIVRYGKEWVLRWAGNTKIIPGTYTSKKNAVVEARKLTSGKITIQLVDTHYMYNTV